VFGRLPLARRGKRRCGSSFGMREKARRDRLAEDAVRRCTRYVHPAPAAALCAGRVVSSPRNKKAQPGGVSGGG